MVVIRCHFFAEGNVAIIFFISLRVVEAYYFTSFLSFSSYKVLEDDGILK